MHSAMLKRMRWDCTKPSRARGGGAEATYGVRGPGPLATPLNRGGGVAGQERQLVGHQVELAGPSGQRPQRRRAAARGHGSGSTESRPPLLRSFRFESRWDHQSPRHLRLYT
jgi:hypothetical protein